jgi:threonine/homoserine/homoserine lactone efflux protein
MTLTLFLGLVTFTFVASITPGPNNMMLLASGANFGLRRTLPHMAGVSLGFGVLVLVVGFALAGIISALPWLYEVLRWAGAAYLLYLAFKIATAHGVGAKAAPKSPMTFWQAAAFQWVNPKALAMCVGAVATYATRDHLYLDVALITSVVVVIGAPCIASWAAFGVGMKRVLNRPGTMRAFNVAMALLLVLSLYPMLTDRLRP